MTVWILYSVALNFFIFLVQYTILIVVAFECVSIQCILLFHSFPPNCFVILTYFFFPDVLPSQLVKFHLTSPVGILVEILFIM